MDRRDYVLAVMAAAEGPLTPVQVQKLFFILDRKIAAQLGGPYFEFVPYNYGPFDAAVYHEFDALALSGLAVVENSGSMRRYALTTGGVRAGLEAFSRNVPASAHDYIRKLVKWIQSLSFAQLVSAVYDVWPEMKAKSIFRG